MRSLEFVTNEIDPFTIDIRQEGFAQYFQSADHRGSAVPEGQERIQLPEAFGECIGLALNVL